MEIACLLDQRPVSARERAGGLGLGARALEVRRGLCRLRVIDARIDLVERLSLPNDRALPEQAALDDAGNLRPDLGDLVSGDAPGKLLLERRAALLNDDVADGGGTARAAAPAAAALSSLLPQAASRRATAAAATVARLCRNGESQGRAFSPVRRGKQGADAFRLKTMSSAWPLDEDLFAKGPPFDERRVPTDEADLVSFPKFIAGERRRRGLGDATAFARPHSPPR